MKSIFIVFVLAALAYGEEVQVVNPDTVSVLGFLRDVAIPAAEARRKAEEQYLSNPEQSRIVGGSASSLGQFPWQAGLVSDIIGLSSNGICGASLISNNRLITAAHCWFDGVNQAWRFNVILGSVLLFGTDGVRQLTSVVAPHPQWLPALTRNDIAIIYLSEAVPIYNLISPISLPSGPELAEDFSGSQAIASGFGYTADGNDIASHQFLSHVQLNVITNTVCTLYYPLNVHSSNICTSGSNGRGTCQGDSGGPLAVVRSNRPVLIGVTSFGARQGCESGRPAAFARVTSFIDFIEEHLQ